MRRPPTVNLLACCVGIALAGRPLGFLELYGAAPGRYNPLRHLRARRLIIDVGRRYATGEQYDGPRPSAYALSGDGVIELAKLGVTPPPEATAAHWIVDGHPTYVWPPQLLGRDPAPGGYLVDGVDRMDAAELRLEAQRLIAAAQFP